MTYSGLHGGAPRPLQGLGAIGIPTDAGVITVPTSAQEAQGYLSQAAAAQARDRFRQETGMDLPAVPTSTSQVGPWAKEQAKIWTGTAIRAGIEAGKRVYEDKMRLAADTFAPLTEDETGAWALAYLTAHGPPRSPEEAIAMARAFVIANADTVGLPPEFIAASTLINGFPGSVDGARIWATQLAQSFLGQFGVPLVFGADVSSFVSASARAAMAQLAPGIPFGMVELSWNSLKDGSLSGDEVKGLVIGAAAWSGAIIGQAFGLPAPIGALIANIVVGEIISVLSDAFGWGPTGSALLRAAQQAASRAAAAETIVCTEQATVLWKAYHHYWDVIEGRLDAVIRANQEWLTPSGSCSRSDGLRLFSDTELDRVRDANGYLVMKRGGEGYERYPVAVYRTCSEPLGCPYLSADMPHIAVRDAYGYGQADLDRVPRIQSMPPGCDALGSLAYWGANRYVTPFQVALAMFGSNKPSDPMAWLAPPAPGQRVADYTWPQVVHSDAEYLKDYVGLVTSGGDKYGTTVTQCLTPAWAAFMFRSLTQAAAATGLVSRDINRTVSTATSYYGIKYHMDALAGMEWTVAAAAQKRAAASAAAAATAEFRYALVEARRKGVRQADLVNYGLLAAGTGAMAGWAASRLWRRR